MTLLPHLIVLVAVWHRYDFWTAIATVAALYIVQPWHPSMLRGTDSTKQSKG